MAKQMTLAEGEIARQAATIKSLSLGWAVTFFSAGLAVLIASWFAPFLPVLPALIICGSGTIMSLLVHWLNRKGHIRVAGYLLIANIVLLAASVTLLFGGFAGSLAVIYILPIVMAGMVVGIRGSYVVATVVSLIYAGMIAVELWGGIPQIIPSAPRDAALVYFTLIAYVIIFYLVAFLSWFAASRLHQALQKVRTYAGELQVSNEKLQASEEELRASNEELEASNEELRATEEELRASNEELVAANTELKEAQEKLVRTEKLAAIGQLAGGVGHELRNPLGAIKNAVYYIRSKLEKSELAQKEPRVMEFLGIVDDEINSSNKIIGDLLNFSRVGKPATSPAHIEMVINDAVAHTVIPENIKLEKAVADSLPEIRIDTDLIRQVLVNMMTNAVQAMPEGGKLTVGARRNGEFMELAVADSGAGIKPENIKRLFDPLFTTKAKGIGLGLAVCKSIIDRHQGSIEVTSEVGKGTTFVIKLPLNHK